MTKKHKLLLTALTVGVAGAVAGFGVFSAFSSTSSNPGNSFTAGSVAIEDNDSSSALYKVDAAKPGVNYDKCIKVTYTGSLDATVKLYVASTLSAGAQYVNLNITSGSGSAASCSDFDPGATPEVVYNGTLQAFRAAHNAWSNGLADHPGTTATKWQQAETVTYRFRASVQDSNSAQGAASGSHEFTWEAQNQ